MLLLPLLHHLKLFLRLQLSQMNSFSSLQTLKNVRAIMLLLHTIFIIMSWKKREEFQKQLIQINKT